MADPETSLGQPTVYPETYDPGLLQPIPRKAGNWHGCDIWTAYELSWLDNAGKPQVAIAEVEVSCRSQAIVESKSFKLYLNSLNQARFDDWSQLKQCLENDLGKAFGGDLRISLFSIEGYAEKGLKMPAAPCLDDLPVTCDVYQPCADFLQADTPSQPVSETLCSHLLKSNCPVTGQPDWASLYIGYIGQPINKAGLLKYIVSYRGHQDFHEHCVERIFQDISERCAPSKLWVYARYTRRGGLDINPYRSSEPGNPDWCRVGRQ